MELIVPEKKWTDERLDDLNTKVDVGFAHVDKRFDRVDEDISGLRGDLNCEAKAIRGEINTRFDKVDERFEGLRRDLLVAAVVIIAALIACCATLIGVA